MKPLEQTIEQYRVKWGQMRSTAADGNNGMFVIPHHVPHGTGTFYQVMVSDGMGWDHVSVCLIRNHGKHPFLDRCPTWEEMSYIKSLFFEEEEAVLQFHPPASSYVNAHPFVLHLWRPQSQVIPMPPVMMV